MGWKDLIRGESHQINRGIQAHFKRIFQHEEIEIPPDKRDNFLGVDFDILPCTTSAYIHTPVNY